jgi:hypothetical protein
MMRTALVLLVLFVSLAISSKSLSSSRIRKSIVRRQSGEPTYCYAIEGFDCKCSYYRVTCTTDRDLPSTIVVAPNEKHKYQSVELVISAERDQVVHEQTFAPAKELFKPDSDNYEFRIKFEKFTALRLTSPSLFNRVFPDQSARKHLAVEIYNPIVRPEDNVNLFQGLNVDSLELYALYPFRGSFQQLFDGANIKYLRLSGGDIHSDLSHSFSGNIGRLELAKQADAISVANFPVYPAHELIINAFYVANFNAEHPPNYGNLGDLRVHSLERIPANAFRQFPNIHTLSLSTDKDIDPQALAGLNKLEKITIKDIQPSLDLFKNLPNLKEIEVSLDKLDDKFKCQLVEKTVKGEVAVQAVPNGRECTCVSAYLDNAAGRTPCDAQNCEKSSCAAIKNNYDASTRTFTAPPPIRRADGSNALRARETIAYTGPFQVSRQDQEKLSQGLPQQQQPQQEQPGQDQQGQPYDPNQQSNEGSQVGSTKRRKKIRTSTQLNQPSIDQQGGEQPYWPPASEGQGEQHQQQQPDHAHHPGKQSHTTYGEGY